MKNWKELVSLAGIGAIAYGLYEVCPAYVWIWIGIALLGFVIVWCAGECLARRAEEPK